MIQQGAQVRAGANSLGVVAAESIIIPQDSPTPLSPGGSSAYADFKDSGRVTAPLAKYVVGTVQLHGISVARGSEGWIDSYTVSLNSELQDSAAMKDLYACGNICTFSIPQLTIRTRFSTTSIFG